jgi:hypothetical protein
VLGALGAIPVAGTLQVLFGEFTARRRAAPRARAPGGVPSAPPANIRS